MLKLNQTTHVDLKVVEIESNNSSGTESNHVDDVYTDKGHTYQHIIVLIPSRIAQLNLGDLHGSVLLFTRMFD